MLTTQAIILAAGQGTRLRPVTTPKCLLKIGRRRLIDYQLNSLKRNGIRKVTIVTGYKAGLVKRYIQTKYPRARITFVTNFHYQVTGPAYSLGLVQNRLRSQFLLLTGDILCSASAIKALLSHRAATVIGATSLLPRKPDAGLLVGRHMRVTKLGKQLPSQKNYYEFTGMIKVGKSFSHQLFTSLEQLNATANRHFVVDAVNHSLRRHRHVKAIDLAPAQIVEIDTVTDWRLANRSLSLN